MTGNPNELGGMCALLSLCMLHVAISRRRASYLLLFALQVYLLVLSGSRTAVLALAAGILAYGLASLWRLAKDQDRRPLVAVMLIVLVAGTGLVITKSPTLFTYQFGGRLAELSDISRSAALADRIDNWSDKKDVFFLSPVVGVGPLLSLSPEDSVFDNEWLQLGRSYGVLGTVLLVSALAAIVFRRKSSDRILGISALVLAGVYMIPAALISSTELMPLFLVLLSAAGALVPMEVSGLRALSTSSRRSEPQQIASRLNLASRWVSGPM